MRIVLYLLSIVLLFVSHALANDDFTPGNQYVKTRLVIDRTAIQPPTEASQATARIGVYFSISPGWHIYWRNSGEGASPTRIEWNLPDGFSIGQQSWPYPMEFHEKGDIRTFGYKNETLLFAELMPPLEELPHESEITIGAAIEFLVCNDICLPGFREHQITLPYSANAELAATDDSSLFGRHLTTIPLHVEGKLLIESTNLSPQRNDDFDLIFKLSNSKKLSASRIAASAKLFPYSVEGLIFGRAKGIESSTNDIWFTLPAKLTTDTLPQQAKGVLVLKSPLIDSPTELALEWSYNFDQASNDILTSDSYQSLDKTTFELTYLVSRADELGRELVEEKSIFSLDFLIAILAALIAGAILNLMPCVLPIISIKVFSFVENKSYTRVQVKQAALAYSLGIVLSFLVLALVVIFLKSIGESLGWGFQFQNPIYVFILLTIIYLLGLAFFEFFSIQLPGLNTLASSLNQKKPSLLRHFFDGILATALATPCTAPFLGTAISFALSQSALATILIFSAIGLGLAIPYVVLTTNPSLLSYIPKPGEWMNSFKQFLGFLLLGTAVWLLFVLDQLTEFSAVWTVLILLVLTFCIWLRKKFSTGATNSYLKITVNLIAIIIFFWSLFQLWPLITTTRSSENTSTISTERIDWKPYYANTVAEVLASGKPVFIDFTADWCVTCKFNERLVLNTARTAKLFKDHNIQAFIADWTMRNDNITQALKSYGGNGVPHYVLIAPLTSDSHVTFPTILTHGILRSTIEQTLQQ